MNAQTGRCSKITATQENHIELEEYTLPVTSYISKCADDVVKIRTVKSFPNEKAWRMNGEVRALSRAKKAALKSGDKEAYDTARAKLKLATRRQSEGISRDWRETSTPTTAKTCGRRSKVLQATKAGALPSCVRPRYQMS